MGNNGTIHLFDSTNFARCTLTDHPYYPMIRIMLSSQLPALIPNLPRNTSLYALQVDDQLTLLAQIDGETGCTYTASFITHYFDYLMAEIRMMMPGFSGRCMLPLLSGIKRFFIRQKLDNILYIGNFFLSTNIHLSWRDDQLTRLHQFIITRFTAHRLVFRSLTAPLDQSLISKLAQLGYQPIISRQVFLTRSRFVSLKKNRSVMRDLALLRKTSFTVRDITSEIEQWADDIARLYQSLYLKKYSDFNPQFTAEFFQQMVLHGGWQATGVFDGEKLVAFSTLMTIGNVTTAAGIGYDESYPQSDGLYRLSGLSSYLRADEHHWVNLSSGVGKFKMGRGAQCYPEYSYYYSHKAPELSRTGFALWRKLLNMIAERFARDRIF